MSFAVDTTVAVVDTPLNDTVAGEVKRAPVIVTSVAGGPEVGAMDDTDGVTVNEPAETVDPADVTLTGPVVAAAGTGTVSFVADTTVAVAAVAPVNVTVDGEVKPVPFTVTTVPGGPEVGVIDVTVAATASGLGLVACELAATTVIRPDVAAAGTVAVIRFAELMWNVRWVECNSTRETEASPVPVMTIDLPAAVVAGDTDVIVGAATGVATGAADASGRAAATEPPHASADIVTTAATETANRLRCVTAIAAAARTRFIVVSGESRRVV